MNEPITRKHSLLPYGSHHKWKVEMVLESKEGPFPLVVSTDQLDECLSTILRGYEALIISITVTKAV